MTTAQLNTMLAVCIIAQRAAEETQDTTKEGQLALALGTLAQEYINSIHITKR